MGGVEAALAVKPRSATDSLLLDVVDVEEESVLLELPMSKPTKRWADEDDDVSTCVGSVESLCGDRSPFFASEASFGDLTSLTPPGIHTLGASGDLWTTLKLSNLPFDLTQDQLVELLQKTGFACKLDFIYLPVQVQSGKSCGFALVNMVTHCDANLLLFTIQNSENQLLLESGVSEASWSSDEQGYSRLVERYRNKSVMHHQVADTLKPKVFSEGRQIPFPKPTQRIRCPRAKR